MSDELYSIFKDSDNKKYRLFSNDKTVTKRELIDISLKLERSLSEKIALSKLEDIKIYLFIENRLTFIAAVALFLKFNAKIVLMPVEIIVDEASFSDGLVISDDKDVKADLFIEEDFSLSKKIEKTLNKFDEEKKDTHIYLYTSGSTAKPKLIPKSDTNLMTEIRELKKRFFIDSSDTFYLTNPIYHIYGFLFGLLLPLYTDSSLYIEHHFTPDTISNFVKNSDISIFVSIPNYYNMFAALNLIDNFSHCKKFFSSSAPLSLATSREFFKNGLKIIEVYGSTETGGIANRVQAISDRWEIFSYVKVMSNEGGEVELFIDSPAISVLYDKDIGFNTNDLVELDSNNNFKLLGRNNRFTKIGGKRVDLYFVRDKMALYLSSILKRDVKREEIYVGEKNEKIYIFFDTDKCDKKNSDIKRELTDYLPSYSIPKYFFWQQIPQNRLGKINKLAIEKIINEVIK